MKRPRIALLVGALVLATAPSVASAVVLDSGTYTWTGAESTQTGRVFRNGVQATWESPKPYPGTLDAGNQHAHVLFGPINVGSTNFLQITFTNAEGEVNNFAVGYTTAFDPTDISTNYLGDRGLSGASQIFQVVLAPGANFFLNVERVTLGPGSGTFSYQVEGFTQPVPEPATLLLIGTGVAGVARNVWRRRRRV